MIERNSICIHYSVDEKSPYGPKWQQRQPPGLPDWARLCSTRGEAIPLVHRIATGLLGEHFARACERLARNESQGRFGLPANRFNALPKWNRPDSAPLITAWGCFQYNAPAWSHLVGMDEDPWEATAVDEVRLPIEKAYAVVWEQALNSGASPYYAERTLRFWHMAPAYVPKLLKAGERVGWESAWNQVAGSYKLGPKPKSGAPDKRDSAKDRIDRKLG